MEKCRGILGLYPIIGRRSWTSVDDVVAETEGGLNMVHVVE
jgi:hypothetical protein